MKLWKVVRRSPVVVPLALAGALVIMLISEGSYWRSVSTLDTLGEIGAARTTIIQLQQDIRDAETSERAYLLTGQVANLQPYTQALKDIDNGFAELDRYYGGAAEPGSTRARLRALTDTKLAALAAAIDRRTADPTLASSELVLTEASREQMGAIRALSMALWAQESLKVDTGSKDLYRSLMLGRVGMAALSAVSLLVLLMYLRQTFALDEQRRFLRDQVQAERNRLETEVRQRTAELTELAQHLQTAREDERGRLARNLHDELGALLTSAKLDAARIRSRLAGSAPEALERLAHLVDTLNSSIALGRSIIEDLRPSTLDNLGLVDTLQILTRNFAANSGVEVHCNLTPVKLETTAELVVYRLVQEAITNISKYAKASQVWLVMSVGNDAHVDISVRDDGVGFDTHAQPGSTYGLVGMRHRIEAEGGTLAVLSAPGHGTRLLVKLPLRPVAAA